MTKEIVSLSEAREAARRAVFQFAADVRSGRRKDVAPEIRDLVGNIGEGQVVSGELERQMEATGQVKANELVEANGRGKPVVIDVPFGNTARTIKQGSAAGDKTILRCQRKLADGRQCGLPAYNGVDQCERHYRWYSLSPNYYELPYPENATAVQETLARTATLLLRKVIEPRVADTVARLCREMMRNLTAYERELESMERSLRWDAEQSVQ